MLVTFRGRSVKSSGSISVSGQLLTYPSPNPTLTLTCYQLTTQLNRPITELIAITIATTITLQTEKFPKLRIFLKKVMSSWEVFSHCEFLPICIVCFFSEIVMIVSSNPVCNHTRN